MKLWVRDVITNDSSVIVSEEKINFLSVVIYRYVVGDNNLNFCPDLNWNINVKAMFTRNKIYLEFFYR